MCRRRVPRVFDKHTQAIVNGRLLRNAFCAPRWRFGGFSFGPHYTILFSGWFLAAGIAAERTQREKEREDKTSRRHTTRDGYRLKTAAHHPCV